MGMKKILVVDFDQEFQRYLAQFLRDEGFDVSTASDGFAGMDKCKSERPDLVITEAMLPKLHGFELCSRVTHSALHKIPVIIVTGVYRDTVYKTEAVRTFGASAYFEKPLDTDDLLVSIRKILGLPAPQGKKADAFDEAILESVAAQVQAAAPAAPPHASPSAPGKDTKDSDKDEIDVMLQSALAEFGLDSPKKKAPAPPAPVAPQPKTKPQPKPKPEPVALVIPPPAPDAAAAKPAENKAGIVEIIAPFGEFSEKKKRAFSPKIFGAAAGVLILTSAMVFVLKPRKAQKVEELMAPPVSEEVVQETASIPQTVETREAPKKIQAEAKAKPAPRKKAETPVSSAAVDDIGPLILQESPQLDITAQETPVPAPKPTAPDEAVAREPEGPGETPAVKTKAGELVPLESVDIPPQVIKKVNPVYPAAAINLKAETSVTVNTLISETGDVLQTAVVGPAKGYLGFDTAAETAVRKWKFRAARKDGVNVRVWKPVTIGFILKKEGQTP